jgi:hypothetical protein
MNFKYILLPCILFVCLNTPLQAQLLKKIKEKANKTLGNNNSDTDKAQENNSSSDNNNEKEKDNNKGVKWCDTVSVTGGPGKNGVEYSKAYSSSNNFNIMYDESTLGLNNDSKGYRIILTEKVNNKVQFIVVENGKVVDTDTKVNARYLTKTSSQNDINDQGSEREAAMKKYIIGDTLKQDIPKSDAKSVTINKVEDDQFEMVMAVAKQTDDYKNMSEEEKKEFEETAKAGIAKNNSMAGTTISVAAQQGGTVAIVTGYKLIVKGKNYGKFQVPPIIDVSPDEMKVFAIGVDDKGAPVMIANGKKTPLDKNKYVAMSGYILRSPDLKKFVYIEQKKLNDKEIEDMTKNVGGNGEMKFAYNILRNDGTSLTVTDYNASGRFKLTNSGAVISINEKTGQVFADNKAIGKFPLQGRDRLESEAVLIGNDISQIAYYNGVEGSITYLDGAVRKMDITYPKVISEKGKSYLSWFRKCKNDIYIARFAY